ncbi:MAG: energy-coupling factor transporter transmembrane component T [Chloroflexota bacterium]|nr:energy-coupling factor transporter transmembrane component T [Chloroflexota bacterium]
MIEFTYSDKGSIIHKLSPYCKAVWFVGMVLLALLFDHPLHLLLLLVCTIIVIFAANVWREWSRIVGMMILLFLPALIFINAVVANEGTHVLWNTSLHIPTLGVMVVTLEGIVYSLLMSLRLLIIVSAFTIITYALHPDDLMLLLLKLRLPYKSVLVTSVSTRFVPTLLADAKTIAEVQRSRGLELDKGNMVLRVRRYVSIFIPLLANSVDRTIQVAEAMESRAFGTGSGRTFYKQIAFGQSDLPALMILLVAFALGIAMALLGQGTYNPYTDLENLGLPSAEGGLLALLGLLLMLLLPLAHLQARRDLD